MPPTATVIEAPSRPHLGGMSRKHRSQFIYDGKHADDQPLMLSLLDLQRFRTLARFPYLPSHWVLALTGGNEQRSYSRLARLAREPHAFLDRRQDWYKHAVYSLTRKGYAAINATPDMTRDPFAHQLLQSLVEASFEIEVTDADHLNWNDIVALGKVPYEALTANAIPLLQDKLLPDGRPNALRRNGKHLFYVKEIDRATEPLSPTTKRRSIQEKFRHYSEFIRRDLYKSHYGFPNCLVLFITTSEARMHGMMKLATKEIGDAKWMLFTHTRDWANEGSYPAPPLGLYTRAWKRNGHPDFYLNQFDA